MNCEKKTPVLALLTALLCWGGLGGNGEAQTFLRNRDFLNLGQPEPYLNYGRKEYDPYPSVVSARNRYDRLGNFLVRGYRVFTWEFQRPGFSEINSRTAQYLGWFNNLMILSDSYRGWNYAVTLGEDIRSKFTDLTFKDPRFYGIQFDGASPNNRFTLLLSQGGAQLRTPKFSTFQTTKERSPVLVFGGHWETKVGSVMKLGTTYFNQHMTDTFNEKGSFIQGDTPYSMLPPSYITVVIEDDSPELEGTPATVYGVDIIIVGERMGEAVRLTSAEGDPDFDPSLRPRVVGRSVAGGGRQAAGWGERVFFEFRMPEYSLPPAGDYATDPDGSLTGLTIKSTRFRIDVAGDYRISMKQDHLFFDEVAHEKNIDKEYSPGHSSYVNPFTGLKGDDASLSPAEAREAGEEVFKRWPTAPDPNVSTSNPFLQYKWDHGDDPENVHYTVLRSQGHDAARTVVEIDYGIPTGQALYGLDGEINLKDLTIRGEFATNPQYFIFPVGSNAGDRFSKRRWAYFLTAKKALGPVALGAEVFEIDPDFSGNYDSARGGIPFFSDRCQICPAMQEMYVMADNDDNDQWRDEDINERPSQERRDSGIFPGLDENQDLVPDSDQNLNGLPDWQEPILFYDADPPEFIYGLDFNNNGVVDFRENDALPDYPYRRDRKGWHALVLKDGLGRIGEWISVGAYRMKSPAGGSEANANYLRYEYNRILPLFGKIRINDDIKWVEDSIPDDVYIWRNVGPTLRIESPVPHLTGKFMDQRDLNTQVLPPDQDPLTMRKSVVNTLFIESHYKKITNLNLINRIKWIRNSQQEEDFGDGTAQEDDILSHITLVNKVDYTVRAGNLTVRPMFKHLLLREHSDKLKEETGKGSKESFSVYTPLVRTRYDLTPKTNLQLGFQGFPFWRYRKLDRADELEGYKEWNLVLMASNQSDHYGYNLASQFGFLKVSREYNDESRSGDAFDTSTLFFDILAGF